MRVPFFRSRAKTDSEDMTGGHLRHSTLRAKKGGLAAGVLDGIASEPELSAFAPATPLSSAGSVARAAPGKAGAAGGAAQAIADQVGEMEAFLATISGFQGEARRLFPENMALDQILGELRDECRRRVDYMTRVSAPPAWMAHQRQASSSSTIIAGSNARRAPPVSAPSSAAAQARARSTSGYGGLDLSPISTATATSSSSSSGSFAENKSGEGGAPGYFSRRQPATSARKALGAGSPPQSPPQSPSLLPAQTVGRRDARVGDQRRRAAPQSMIVAGSAGEIAATRASAAANRSATSHGATMPKLPRASVALPALDSPRFTKVRTSSTDNFGRPLSFADPGDANSPAQLATKGSFGAMRPAKPKQQ
ncbi:hypothetical protein GGH95_004962, partial [Coemansia sp. RSA 1836]